MNRKSYGSFQNVFQNYRLKKMGKADTCFITSLVYILLCYQFDLTNGAQRDIQTIRPIIGVMAQSSHNMTFAPLGDTYIAASYVKFLESSGARVIPIFNNLTESETVKLFKSINGVLFPGGIVSVLNSSYANISKIIYRLAKKTFDEGGYFPIMGMCLGHQILAMLHANDNTVDLRIYTDSNNMTAPLNLPKNYRDYKLFRGIPNDWARAFNQTPITGHFHDLGIPVKLFRENEKLKSFYNILTTNVDRNGVEFVSTMEAKKYPFYSMQWHPEKPPFEWTREKVIPHFPASIQLSQYLSNFFVQEARFSKHKFLSEREEKTACIYNYNPTYTGIKEHSIFDQIYIF